MAQPFQCYRLDGSFGAPPQICLHRVDAWPHAGYVQGHTVHRTPFCKAGLLRGWMHSGAGWNWAMAMGHAWTPQWESLPAWMGRKGYFGVGAASSRVIVPMTERDIYSGYVLNKAKRTCM